jgi:hypothetical protein
LIALTIPTGDHHASLARTALTRSLDVSALTGELGVTWQTLYRHVGPGGERRSDGQKLMAKRAA